MGMDLDFRGTGFAPEGGIYSVVSYPDFAFGDTLSLHLLTHPTGTDTVSNPNVTVMNDAIYNGYIKAGDLCFTVNSGKLSINNIVDPFSTSKDLIRFDFTPSNITDISGNTLPQSAFGPISVIFAGPASTINNASVATAFNALGAGKFNDSGNRIVFTGSNPNNQAEGRFNEFLLLGKGDGGDLGHNSGGVNGVKDAVVVLQTGETGSDIIGIPGGPVPAPGASAVLGIAALLAFSRRGRRRPEEVKVPSGPCLDI